MEQNNADALLASYRANKGYFFKGHPSFILSNKKSAEECLIRYGLPTKKLEDYKRSDINALFNRPFHFTNELPENCCKNDVLTPQFFSEYVINNLQTLRAVIMNDKFVGCDTEPSTIFPNGVFVGSLPNFLLQYPQKEAHVKQIFGRYAENDIDGLVAMNSLFFRDVFVFYVPKGVRIQHPLLIIQAMKAPFDIFVATRFLFILEDDAEANIILTDHSGCDSTFVSNRVIEVAVEKRAKLGLYDIERSKGNNEKLSTIVLRQQEDSHVSMGEYTLGNGFTRNNYRSRFMGERAELILNGLVLGHKDCHIDNFTRVEHVVSECHTDELFKYLLMDNAVGSFTGRIFIAQGAQKTTAYQQDRNLLLSPEARAYAKPFLEIYADDVHCSHGMTTGQLNEDALFYMQQRGIPEDEARIMLSIAFAVEVIERIQIPELREAVRTIVENDFYKKQ